MNTQKMVARLKALELRKGFTVLWPTLDGTMEEQIADHLANNGGRYYCSPLQQSKLDDLPEGW